MAEDDTTVRRHSDTTRAKIREAMTGKKKTPEHVEHWKAAMAGKRGGPHNEERIARIRAGNVAAESPRKKADWDDVREIRLLHRLGHTARQIGERFPHLSLATIRDIIAERTWKEEFRPRK